jgi:transposase-like protein
MTAVPSIDPAGFLNEHLAQASPDLMRELVSTFIQTLLSADADAGHGGIPESSRRSPQPGHVGV